MNYRTARFLAANYRHFVRRPNYKWNAKGTLNMNVHNCGTHGPKDKGNLTLKQPLERIPLQLQLKASVFCQRVRSRLSGPVLRELHSYREQTETITIFFVVHKRYYYFSFSTMAASEVHDGGPPLLSNTGTIIEATTAIKEPTTPCRRRDRGTERA